MSTNRFEYYNEDFLQYKHCREKTATQILVVLIVELCLAIQGLTHYINCSKFKLELKELTVCIVHQTNRVPSTMN